MLIVDTDIIVDIQGGHVPAEVWFEDFKERVSVTGFSVMELIQNSSDARQVALVQKLVRPFLVVWPSMADCEAALELYAVKHRSDGIGLIDTLIAATAKGLGAELATFNTKHFRAVEGLRLVQPYER